MTENETIDQSIQLLKGMQNPKVDYADLVGAEPYSRGYRYVYPEPEDYAIEDAIAALKEVQQYREIGTMEECREAVEKQNQKPLDFYGDSEYGKLLCPNCGNDLWELKECGFNNCPYCGQAISWKESEEE